MRRGLSAPGTLGLRPGRVNLHRDRIDHDAVVLMCFFDRDQRGEHVLAHPFRIAIQWRPIAAAARKNEANPVAGRETAVNTVLNLFSVVPQAVGGSIFAAQSPLDGEVADGRTP